MPQCRFLNKGTSSGTSWPKLSRDVMLSTRHSQEKAKLESDLKNAEMKLLVLYEELLTLNELEEKDETLLKKATKCRQDKTSVMHQIKECQDQLSEKKAEIEEWHTQEQNLQVESCLRAYQLLRSKLDFPKEDIIFDCLLTPVGSEVPASVKDFIDAVSEVKGLCPGVSFTAGVSNLSHGARTAAMLREALASAFLQHAVPKGLNFAFVELGHLPRLDSIEEPTKSMCIEVMNTQAPDGPHVSKLLNFAAFLSGSAAAEEAQKKAPRNTLQRKDKAALVPVVQKQTPPEPLRPSPQFIHPVETLVQATGTVSSSIFQTFGSKAHAAANYHRLITATTINRTVHFSSISVYMGQGGSGPVTGASGIMDGLALWERHQGINQYSTTVLWGAIGEIGLRKAIYGSRDVFAQFDLGQKLIGPADTAFLEKAVCLNPATWDFVGLAYLDNTWQDSLAGRGATTGLQGRKTFVDN